MHNNLIEILEKLKAKGFSNHIYGNSKNWFHNGKPLANTTEQLLEPFYDEQDKRILIYKVTSTCGLIRGVAIV